MPKIEKLPDGHALYFESENDVYIMDDEQQTPETAPDALRLSKDQPLIAEMDQLAIPAIDSDGTARRVETNAATVFELAGQFDWKVSNGESLFEVRRSGRVSA